MKKQTIQHAIGRQEPLYLVADCKNASLTDLYVARKDLKQAGYEMAVMLFLTPEYGKRVKLKPVAVCFCMEKDISKVLVEEAKKGYMLFVTSID